MSTTGEKGQLDQNLLTGLKDAKSARCHFACVMAGAKKGLLMIMKQKVPPAAVASAKKACGGTQEIEGACFYENGTYIFETADEPAQTLADSLKLFAKQQSAATIKVECRQGNNPDLQSQPTARRPLPPLPNTTGGGQPPTPTVDANKPKPPTTPPKPKQTTAQTPPQPNQYASEASWRHKINQVDVAKVPSATKVVAYDKIAIELRADVDRLAKDMTVAPNAKADMQLMHQGVQLLLSLRRRTADARATQDRNAAPLIDARKSANQRATAYVNGVADKFGPFDLKTVMEPFSKKNVDAMADKTDSGDSKFGAVITAMNLFREAEPMLKNGKLPYEGFIPMLRKVQEEARTYRDAHKGAITSAGKQRLKQCSAVLDAINEVERVITEKNTQFHKVLTDTAAEIHRGGICPQMRDAIDDVLKSNYTSDTNRAAATRLRAEIVRLLQTKTDQALNSRPNATSGDRAEILLLNGGSNPPRGKGQSDSFFIHNPDGTPAFIFKSLEGEARNTSNWPEGGGAPREILASAMNDLMKQHTGFDFKIAKTTLYKTTDENFTKGSISKSTQRSGALQEAIQIDPTKPTSPLDFLKGKKTELQAKYDALNSDDIESLAVLDLITLNTDRHGDNTLMQNVGDTPGQTRVVPIDAGQMFPTKAAFGVGSGALLAETPFDPNNPQTIDSGQNMVTQLPQANKPFSQKSKDAIARLDPEKFVAGMKAQYDNLVSEAPEMAGKVDDSSFDLMKRSIKVLEKGAAQDLTPRQISYLTATVLPKIMDAPDDQFNAALTKAINELKRIAELGGEQALIDKGFAKPTEWPIDIQKEILEKDLSVDDAQQVHFAQLQQELADLPTFLQFENGAAFQLGDWLTRPYTNDDYQFLWSAATYKKAGGDPTLRVLLAEEPRIVDVNLRLPLGKKFSTLNRANTIYKHGGFLKARAKMGDADYNKAVQENDIWSIELAATK